MGNCVSSQDREAAQRSQEIDKQIEEDSRKFKKECKILLLGTPHFTLSCSPRGGRKARGHRLWGVYLHSPRTALTRTARK